MYELDQNIRVGSWRWLSPGMGVEKRMHGRRETLCRGSYKTSHRLAPREGAFCIHDYQALVERISYSTGIVRGESDNIRGP